MAGNRHMSGDAPPGKTAYAAAYRRDVFLSYGGFDEDLSVCEDQELSFRLGSEGYRMAFLPEAVVYHRHPASIARYLARKSRIAYWKVQVLLQHPDKAMRDSYTPQALKVQMALVPFMILALALVPFWHLAWLASAVLGGLFLAVAVPFVTFCLREDLAVGLASPPLILGRATALAGGRRTAWWRSISWARSWDLS